MTKACKDCGSTTRKLDKPGPRDATCWRIETKRRREAAYAKHIESTYGITLAEYEALYAHQDGRCAICQHATGKTRRLAVDHNHKTGEVRGLLCKRCNRYLLGYVHDDTSVLLRAADYLDNPPARRVLNG